MFYYPVSHTLEKALEKIHKIIYFFPFRQKLYMAVVPIALFPRKATYAKLRKKSRKLKIFNCRFCEMYI